MMKKIVVILLLALVPIVAEGQNVRKKKKPAPTPPTVLSVGEILGNYGLDSALVNDTAAAIAAVDTGDKSYVDLTSLCVSLRTKAQQALQSIENDYVVRDSLVWIDSNTVLGDVTIYSYRLRRYADLMGRLSVRYSRLEQQRIEAEKEAARQRAIEEARRQQEARDKRASDLKGNIDRHHRAIITATDGIGVTDKGKLKALKDLYYSYLMVYNKYDLSSGPATHDLISRLDELNAFQTDLLDNVLGHNSLPYQIENFKNVLKLRCEKDNNDVYRSYTKVFKRTAVPISFADIAEYEDYISRMQTMINVQQRYLQTLDFRATIASQNDKLKKAVDGFDEIIETLPEAPENLEIAKASILGRLRTQRTIGDRVLYSYLTAQELGLTEPREKQVYEKVSALTMDDLLATHAKWIKGRPYVYAILGDPTDLDMDFLKTLGPVQQVTLEEIFGY